MCLHASNGMFTTCATCCLTGASQVDVDNAFTPFMPPPRTLCVRGAMANRAFGSYTLKQRVALSWVKAGFHLARRSTDRVANQYGTWYQVPSGTWYIIIIRCCTI